MNLKLCTVLGLIAISHFALATTTTYGGRISNGVNATEKHSFAVRVISVVNEVTPNGALSSGVAVTVRHIVTVAQAIFGFNVWHIGYDSVNVDEQLITISRNGAVHNQYNPTLLHNNIGVIRVDDELTKWIEINFTATLQIATVGYGYGVINAENELASTLKRAILNTQTRNTCVSYFNAVVVRDDNFCATSVSQIRNGDQGGPVTDPMVENVIGIIAFWGSLTGSSIVMVDLREHRTFLEEQFAL